MRDGRDSRLSTYKAWRDYTRFERYHRDKLEVNGKLYSRAAGLGNV